MINFNKNTYRLDDGTYTGSITGSWFCTDKNGDQRWVVRISISSKITFTFSVKIPLDTNSAFGECIYNECEGDEDSDIELIIGHVVTFTIKNSTSNNGTRFSNIVEFSFDN